MKPQLSIEAFADWCERKPADEAYDYDDCENCACGQFSHFLGVERDYELPGGFWITAQVHAARAEPNTFGALAKRLRSSH